MSIRLACALKKQEKNRGKSKFIQLFLKEDPETPLITLNYTRREHQGCEPLSQAEAKVHVYLDKQADMNHKNQVNPHRHCKTCLHRHYSTSIQRATLKQDILNNIQHLLSKKYIKINFIIYFLHCQQKCPAILSDMILI